MPINRPCAVVAVTASIALAGALVGGPAASATQADGTYTCVNGHVATRVVVHGASLTDNFDAAQYDADGTQAQAVHRDANGHVADLVFYFDGVRTSVTFRPHYTGPNGADATTPLVVAHISGAVPACAPSQHTVPHPPTTVRPPSSTTTPASNTTRVTHPSSSVPPGSTSHTLPPTGVPSGVRTVAGWALAALALGLAAVGIGYIGHDGRPR